MDTKVLEAVIVQMMSGHLLAGRLCAAMWRVNMPQLTAENSCYVLLEMAPNFGALYMVMFVSFHCSVVDCQIAAQGTVQHS